MLARPSLTRKTFGSSSPLLVRKFRRDLAELGLATLATPDSTREVTASDVTRLPPSVQRYLEFMRVVGRPKTWSFRARALGVFRMEHGGRWLPCEAWQYDTSADPARVFYMRLRLASLVPLLVRDTYVRGVGRMRGRAFGAVPVVDVADEAIAASELVTYLNDAILFAPGMLLGKPYVEWEAADEDSFTVSIEHMGRRASGRVSLDARGAPSDFVTSDRWAADPRAPRQSVRAPWSTPISAWQLAHDRPVPKDARAIWHFGHGDFPYADLTFSAEDIAFDVGPT